MAQKIEITDLNQPYVAPDGASIDQLKELAVDAQQRALAILDKDEYTDEEYAQAEWLGNAIDAINVTVGELETAEADKQRKREELKAKVAPTDPNGGEGDGDGSEPAPAPAPAPDAVPVPVLAAAVVPSIADIARNSTAPDVKAIRPSSGSANLIAAADVPGFSNGQDLTVADLGKAFEARAKGLPRQGAGRVQSGFAKIVLAADPALTASSTNDDINEVLNRAVDESRLPGGSLVAAGGWCAPSETLYDLLNVSTRDGLISIPEVSVNRGGVKFALGPEFSTVYAGGGFTSLTESQVIGGSTKGVFNIPCPSWTDNRMGVDVAYFTGDILTERGFPEGLTDYITKALIVFDHLTSFNTISDMVAGSTAVDMTTSSAAPQTDFGATAQILGSLELQVMDMKYRGRLSLTDSVEVVLPVYAKGIMRSDLTKRVGLGPEQIAVADAQIDALFRARNMNVQYVYDWQENISSGGTANPFGNGAASGFATQWPQKLKALVYPAGTWARALSPVLELSSVYDSTLLPHNQYVALFTERGRLTLKKGFDSRVVTVYSNPSGLTSGYISQSHPAAATLF